MMLSEKKKKNSSLLFLLKTLFKRARATFPAGDRERRESGTLEHLESKDISTEETGFRTTKNQLRSNYDFWKTGANRIVVI